MYVNDVTFKCWSYKAEFNVQEVQITNCAIFFNRSQRFQRPNAQN